MSNITTSPTTANTYYFAAYRSTVTNYYPSSTTVTSTQTLYRNQWFTNSTTLADTKISTSTTGTSNFTATTVTGYTTLVGFAASAGTNTPAYSTVAALATASACDTTVYQIDKKTESISATFYYSNSDTGTKTNSSVSGTRTTFLRPTSTTVAATSVSEGSISAPSTTAPYGTSLVGWATSASTMSTATVNTANTSYYAVYRKDNVRINYYNSSYTTRTDIYRNGVYGSNTKYTMYLATSNTGTSNYATAAGPGSSAWAGLSTGADSTPEYTNVGDYNTGAAYSSTNTFYTVYQFNVSYSIGSNVASIGTTSGAGIGYCRVSATSQSAGGSNCTVTLPSITPNDGYTSVGWNTTSGATSGTAAGASYTVSANTTSLFANATDQTAPTISLSANSDSTYAKTKSVTVTLADAGSGLASGASVKYGWSTSTSTAPSSYTTATLSYSAGAKSTTFTASGSGFTGSYYLWVVPTTLKDVAQNTNSTTLKSTGTFKFDNTPPDCSWGSWSASYLKSSQTATITLTCTDSHSGVTMELPTSNITVSNPSAGTLSGPTKAGTNAERTYTYTLTCAATGSVKLTLPANTVQDAATNKLTTAKESGTVICDTTAPTLAVSVPNGTTYEKSKTATVTIADTGGSGLSNTAYTIRYVWSTSSVTTCNATSMPNTITITPSAGDSSKTGTITLDTSTGAGTLYICNGAAITDRAGNSLAASQIKSASAYLDNTAPVCTCGSWSDSIIGGNQTATISLTCTDSHSGVPSTTFAASLSNSSLGSLGTPTVSGSASSRVFTFTFTSANISGTTTMSLPANTVTDNALNAAAAKTCGSIEVDATAPEVTFGTNGNTTYAKTQSTTVSATDAHGVTTLKYLWTQTNGDSAASGTSFSSGDTVTKNTGTGVWYLCVYAVDTYGNVGEACSSAFYLDNTAPTITANDFCIRKGTSVSALSFASAYDNESGVSGSITATINNTAVTDLSGYAVGTYTVTYSVSDAAGNTGTGTATLNVYMLAADIPVVTSGNGLRTDAFTSGRKAFRGSSVNNYLTLGGITWRILGIETDGTIKLVTNDIQTARKYRPSYSSGTLTFVTTETDSLYYYLNNTFKSNLETAIDNTAVYGQIVQSHSYSVGAVSVLYYASYSGETIGKMINQENATKSSFTVGIMNPSDIARASTNTNCTSSTLMTSSGNCWNSNYLNISNAVYFLMNPYTNNGANDVTTVDRPSVSTMYYYAGPKTSKGYRAVIYLKADTKLLGAGTSASPYTVSAACTGTSAATCTITTDSGYDTSKTLTANVTLNGATISNYVWSNGDSGASKTSTDVSTSGTHTLTIFDSNNLTNTCSISLSSRTEYRQATCSSPTYTNWAALNPGYTSSCYASTLELWKKECNNVYQMTGSCTANGGGQISPPSGTYTSLSACQSGCSAFLGTQCSSELGGTCNCQQQYTNYTRSCGACGSQGAWGSWQTTPIEQNTCSIVVGTRTTIGQ